MSEENYNRILVTDCGSTTTKALLFENTSEGWKKTARGEAPTTVEEPVANVTVGALNAFTEVQEISGNRILAETPGEHPFLLREKGDKEGEGIDLYLSTSSAGGGLQMMVSGIVKEMSTESAERAALGAGAIVLEAISADDQREDHERIERIRHLRPDIVLITGGTDGGSTVHVTEMAEMLVAADPRPRFGQTLKLPVIYAGNASAEEEVREILSDHAQISSVPNVRPELEREHLGPAREAIHEFFLSHVMSHSPGYGTLMKWTPKPVMPTPAAVGNIVHQYASDTGQSVLCADIGGATTDVFSVFRNQQDTPIFNRTVSANLGMSYSVANVLVEAGVENLRRWLPYEISDHQIRDRLRNKMIRPTSIPQTKDDLWLEQAVCREALRLSLVHHRSLAVGLSGAQRQRSIGEMFLQQANRYELVDLKALDLVIGSGGVLSHAPDRLQSALMMLDGFGLEGVTQLTVDSIFMMPHLGVLGSVNGEAARTLFEKECLVNIAHSVVPIWSGRLPSTRSLASVFFDDEEVARVLPGKVSVERSLAERTGMLRVEPVKNSVDVGAGRGKPYERQVTLGLYGLILDGRGRPILAAQDGQSERQKELFSDIGIA